MENCISILTNFVPRNEPFAINALRQFCSENEKVFSLFHLDVNHRKNFIDVILNELTTKPEIGLEFATYAISTLRILSRDKDGLGSLSSEKSTSTLLSLAGILPEESKDTGNTCSIDVGNRISDDRSEVLDRLIARSTVVTEAVKCLCNVVYHSSVARQYCFKLRCIEAIIERGKRWFDNGLLAFDVKYFDMRFLFLLTALENTARFEVVANNGFCVLTHALDSCIPGKEQRKVCHETKVRDGCGQITGAQLQALTMEERAMIEQAPNTYTITQNEIRLSAEIMKILFNITLNLPESEGTDTVDHCDRIVFIVRSIFVHLKPLPNEPENLPNHAINVLSNMPTKCLKHLMWTMPSTVSKKLSQDYESKPSSQRFRMQFENYNMLAIQTMIRILDDRLKATAQPLRENIIPIVSAFCQMARGDRIIRKYLRMEVLPPLRHVGTTRPEEGNLIRNGLVRLMTSPLEDIKELVADFVFVLCKENVNRLVKYTGYGNAAGLLASRGLMGASQLQGNGTYYSSDDDSETEEYAMDKAQIDPMIGAIPKDDGKPNPLDEMSEQEKEEEAEKLAALIQDLNRRGVIRTAQVGPDGRPQAEGEDTEDTQPVNPDH
ncbi:synembryn-A-like [Montipora capricornis]|uniref:synembryn-A-like n=1 Tax=Montipora capricornis TaxID=246305 RepID=UPI0035F10326